MSEYTSGPQPTQNQPSRNKATKAAKAVQRAVISVLTALAILIGGVLLFGACTYTIGESEQAVVYRFGAMQEVVLSPGNNFLETHPDLMAGSDAQLHNVKVTYAKGLRFRVPFVTDVRKFDSRLYTYLSEMAMVNTSEKKQYYISIYANWNIANPALFAIRQSTAVQANQYLDSLVYPAVVQRINNLNSEQFISDKALLNSTLAASVEEINRTVADSGIVLGDIQIHRTTLPPNNLESTYARMQADRAKVAQQLRSEGEESYQMAIAQADREARDLESDALYEAERIRGQGDAEALKIYADAYSGDPEFYAYWRSLRALEASIDENSTLVLDPNHPLWNDVLKWIAQ